jgi:choline monooxygenase
LSGVIDSNIRKAHALPSEYYTSESRLDEIRKSFSNYWHFAAHRSQLADSTVVTLPHIEELLGEPMILTSADEIRCLSNVCTHRGMLIANHECSATSLQCPYHGRTFDLEGCLKSMPEFDDVDGFPSESDNLRQFPTMEWNGIVFSGTNPSKIGTWIEELEKRLGWMPIISFEHDKTRHRSYEINANWALYVDNYLEGFHIPFVHKGLHGVLDYDNYRTELFEEGVLQIGIASENESSFDLPETSPDFGSEVAAYYYWLFPGMMLNFYPWGLSVNLVLPITADRTRIVYHGFVGDKSMLGKGAGGDLDKVEEEDQEIVEATQRGVSSGSYDRGRYSPERELGVHHFHSILCSQEGIHN